MLQAIAQNWWMLLLRGICAIAFGIMAYAWPGLTLLVLVIMFGAHALVDGVAAIVLGLGSRKIDGSWWSMVLVGVLGIAAGLISFVWPQITATVLLVIIASWAILRGVFEIVAAVRLRKIIEGEWLMGLAGACSIAFGILLVAWPAAGLLTLTWLIGAASIVFGIVCIALSLRLRGLNERFKPTIPPTAAPAV